MCWRAARGRSIGEVVVATDSRGGRGRRREGRRARGHDARRPSVRLRPHFRGAGSARSRAAASSIVVNVQGDLPTLDPADIRAALAPLEDPAVDIATLAAEIRDPHERDQSERREGARLAGRARPLARALLHPRRPRPTATGRSTITSASTPIGARRSSASSRCRHRRTRSASGSSSCARSMPACASTSRGRLGAARRRHAGGPGQGARDARR